MNQEQMWEMFNHAILKGILQGYGNLIILLILIVAFILFVFLIIKLIKIVFKKSNKCKHYTLQHDRFEQFRLEPREIKNEPFYHRFIQLDVERTDFEQNVIDDLKKNLGSLYSILHNVILENRMVSGVVLGIPLKEYVQFDCIILSPYGIFVINIQYQTGFISIGEDLKQNTWIETVANQHKQFENPLQKNLEQTQLLANFLQLPIHYFYPVLVFPSAKVSFKDKIPNNIVSNCSRYILQFPQTVLEISKLQEIHRTLYNAYLKDIPKFKITPIVSDKNTKETSFKPHTKSVAGNKNHQKDIHYMNIVASGTFLLGGAYFLFFFSWMLLDYLKFPHKFEMYKYPLQSALIIFIVLVVLFIFLKIISRSNK